MPKCPRCSSSMILDFEMKASDWQEPWERTWKCLGCGREIVLSSKSGSEVESKEEKRRTS